MLSFNPNKENCTGCGACYSICPKHCIEMKPDQEGFLYPELVNIEKCIDCGLCLDVCPMLRKRDVQDFEKVAFAATSLDKSIWLKSASGGAFSGICMSWGDEDTIVVGAAWDNLKVHHSCIRGVQNITPLCKSKYVASNLEDTFIEIKRALKNGTKVIFCGTPCQVAGLRCFLRKPYKNLLLIDLICHGVSSPSVFSSCLKVIGEQSEGEIQSYEFRYKDNRYEQDYISRVNIKDGKSKILIKDQCMQLFLSQLALRPSCVKYCAFRNRNRPGDITIGDARGLNEFIKVDYDRTVNYTHVIINTARGSEVLSNLDKYMKIYPCTVEDVTKYNPLFERNTSFNEKRDQFFADFMIDHVGAIKKYTKPYCEYKLTCKRIARKYMPKWMLNKLLKLYS